MNIFGLSDVGLARENNEDTCLYELRDEGAQAIFVVCDGMGGARAGNVASDIAANVFVEQIEKQIRPSMSTKYMESILRNAIDFANYDTYRTAHSSNEYQGMGTTLVGGFANGRARYAGECWRQPRVSLYAGGHAARDARPFPGRGIGTARRNYGGTGQRTSSP